MKPSWGFIALGVLTGTIRAQATNRGDGWMPPVRDGRARFAEESVAEVGVAEVHPMEPEDGQVGENLIQDLEATGQTTGEIPRPAAHARVVRSLPAV